MAGLEFRASAQIQNQRALIHRPHQILRAEGAEIVSLGPQLEYHDQSGCNDSEGHQPRMVSGIFGKTFHRPSAVRKVGADYIDYASPMMSLRHCSLFALALLSAVVLDPSRAVAQGGQQSKAETDLQRVREQMERVREALNRDAAQRDKLAKELRAAETAAGSARGEVHRLQRERAQKSEEKARLLLDRDNQQAALAADRQALAGQMRAAFLIGREEPLKLLLNQRDPARAGRMFAYYSYFGRARAEQIRDMETRVHRIAAVEAELSQQESQLATLEQSRRAELDRLEKARGQRSIVLAGLTEEARSKAASLRRLQTQQASLEKLLRDLRRAIERFPVDSSSQFSKLRGALTWPVSGHLLARYAETRAGGLKWDGMLIGTARATPVRAIYHGRVLYADWLAGLGLLVIIDHGDGYMSLYGHNDSLFKRAGDKVTAGDTIAAAGDSGGRKEPQLYFEIRRGGKPIDPRPWFRSATPTN